MSEKIPENLAPNKPREIHHDEETPFKTCSWCDEENGVLHTGNVSHGMCPAHAAKEIEEMTSEANQ